MGLRFKGVSQNSDHTLFLIYHVENKITEKWKVVCDSFLSVQKIEKTNNHPFNRL